jgi:hypothetical protein
MKIQPTFCEAVISASTTSSCCRRAEQPQPQPSNKRRKRCSVTFREEEHVCEIPSLEEYTEEELNACWYTKAEYKSFKRSSLVTLKLNRAGEIPVGSTEHTMRGLECRTREGAQERKDNRTEAWTVVLQEQERQHKAHLNDIVALSNLYHQVTDRLQYAACIQGMCDELEAREYLSLAQAVAGRRRCSLSSSAVSHHFSALAHQHTTTADNHNKSWTMSDSKTWRLQGILDHSVYKSMGASPAA